MIPVNGVRVQIIDNYISVVIPSTRPHLPLPHLIDLVSTAIDGFEVDLDLAEDAMKNKERRTLIRLGYWKFHE